MRQNRAVKILLICVLLLAIILAGLYAGLSYYGKLPWDSNAPLTTTTNQPTTTQISAEVGAELPRTLDGIIVASQDSNRFPIAVMIENLVDIRPQSGLSDAGVVYEALVEGGITRFMAVYTTTDSIAKIGPVRSARHYFVDWAEEYGGIYAYVGGSPQALGVTDSSAYITDLNQFYNAAYYYRDDQINAPHNLFSSSELFNYALRDLTLDTQPGDYQPYLFKTDPPKTDWPSAVAALQISYSSADYAVEWRYDPTTNSYLRWNGGETHLDANTNKQLTARNIIVQRVETTVLEAATGRLDMVTRGEGDALLFQDGEVKVGKWSKPERGQRTVFLDADGSEWQFNTGSTWIEIVPTDTQVTY